jgi:hypothetical protein
VHSGRLRLRRSAGLSLAFLTALALMVAPLGRPGDATPPQVHFTAVGDFHAIAGTDTVLSGIRGIAPDLTLALGDFSYGSTPTEQAWCDFVTARVGAGYPFELVVGNHESNGPDGHINNYSACLPNQLPGVVGTYGRQWYVDHPRVNPTTRFVMISPGLTFPEGPWSYAAGSPRYQWTADAIDGARANGIPWVVVGLHKPCISIGQYGCDGQVDIHNLLVSRKVDLVLNGHEHLYQRSHQLAVRAGCPAVVPGQYNASCVRDADDELVRGAGTVFATVGTGGVPLRDVNVLDAEAAYFRAWSGRNSSPSHGFLDVVADAETLRARFVATTGGFSDAFTIAPAKGPVAPQTLAADAFSRSVTSGFGTADVGGSWSVSGSSSNVSVAGGAGRIIARTAATGQGVSLTTPRTTRADMSVTWSVDKPATGGGIYLYTLARRVVGEGDYRTKIRLLSNSSVSLAVDRADSAGVETNILRATTVPGLTYAAGDQLRLRTQVVGTSPTTLHAKVWRAGTPEPATWLLSGTDATPVLQIAGGFGLRTYLSSTVTNAPITISVDDLEVVEAAP